VGLRDKVHMAFDRVEISGELAWKVVAWMLFELHNM